jgi:hypothetical protein
LQHLADIDRNGVRRGGDVWAETGDGVVGGDIAAGQNAVHVLFEHIQRVHGARGQHFPSLTAVAASRSDVSDATGHTVST